MVRWAELKDAHLIASLELRSAEYENRAQPFTLTESQFTSLWMDRLKSDEFKTMIAYGAKCVYGFLTFKKDIRLGKVLALYVDPPFMRLGVGKVLLETAFEMVKLKGGRFIEVDVERLNNGAITFYESLLFKKVSVKLDHLIVMRKEIQNA